MGRRRRSRQRTKKKKCKRLKWRRRQRYSKISPKRWEKKCRPGVPSKETTNYFCHFPHFVHCQGFCENEECMCRVCQKSNHQGFLKQSGCECFERSIKCKFMQKCP